MDNDDKKVLGALCTLVFFGMVWIFVVMLRDAGQQEQLNLHKNQIEQIKNTQNVDRSYNDLVNGHQSDRIRDLEHAQFRSPQPKWDLMPKVEVKSTDHGTWKWNVKWTKEK